MKVHAFPPKENTRNLTVDDGYPAPRNGSAEGTAIETSFVGNFDTEVLQEIWPK